MSTQPIIDPCASFALSTDSSGQQLEQIDLCRIRVKRGQEFLVDPPSEPDLPNLILIP